MLSDEEKKAIEMIEHIQECNTLIGYRVEDRTILAKALLNLIEKQAKEIEENKKYLVNLTHEQYIKLVEQIRSEINKEWKDVIKAKIEDLKENSNGDDFNLTNVIMILQSLLEKE